MISPRRHIYIIVVNEMYTYRSSVIQNGYTKRLPVILIRETTEIFQFYYE